MKWITALNLANWARTNLAREVFPGMIADLIRASSDQIASIRFPRGDMGQVRGFDGVLVANGAPPYVPSGESIWEFGVGSEPIVKANNDFAKRVREIPAVDRAKMTFVFASPHTWVQSREKIDTWLKKKRDLGEWKQVEYIDGSKIEDWLDLHPAVAARYARNDLRLMPPTGAISTDEFWHEFATRFKPALTEEVLLCGREAQAEKLIGALKSEPDIVHFAADSPDEVIAFAVAAIRKAPEEVRFFLEARTLIVETSEAARQLSVKSNLIFLPRGQARSSMVGALANSGHHVVASAGADEAKRTHELLMRPSRSELGRALANMMGKTESEGFEIARKCGRSLAVLARQITSSTAETPEWVVHARHLIPALFAGGWSSVSDADRAALADLGGHSDYDAIEMPLRPLVRLKDPPIDRVEDVWKMRAPIDAYTYLAPMVGEADLSRLKSVATTVFGKVTPVPSSDDLFQQPSQRDATHSEWLRDGLMTTLLLIAAMDGVADLNTPGTTPQRFVDDIVKSLPGLSSDVRLIVSLEDKLPLLAEAAPDPFLGALERLLEGGAIRSIFNEEENWLAPTSPHVSVLWALEVLAWEPKNLLRVASVLAQLAAIDPGGKLGNRPINSLRSIFLSWAPNTNATVNQRVAVLAHVVRTVPQVAWDLLSALLPRHLDSSSPTQKPRFREAEISGSERLTYGVVWESQRAIVSMALEQLGNSPGRFKSLISSMAQFDSDSLERSLEAIENFFSVAQEAERLDVWKYLRDEAKRHHRFESADWAIKGDTLRRIDEIVAHFMPTDLTITNAWLFDDWLPYVSAEANESQETIEFQRAKALKTLLEIQGVAGIASFA